MARNYKLDKQLESITTFRKYQSLIRKPASEETAAAYKHAQDLGIQSLMRYAWTIPFYRERFEESGTQPSDYRCAEDLYKFPVLNKDELREWMDREAAENPQKYELWSVSPTSGSTGLPLRVLQSPNEHAAYTANWLRTISLPGYNPFTGVTMSRPNSLHFKTGEPKTSDSPIQKLGILRHIYMSDTILGRVETQTLVDEINAGKPDYLYNHKNVLVRIAKYVKDNGLEIWQPKFYTPISEMLDGPSAILLKEVFGPGLVDAYGMSETGSCVVRLPGNELYQVNADTHVVNVYKRDLSGRADSGMAVITPLMKDELPIINYATLDYMDSIEKDGLRFVKSIQGRMNDAIKLPNGGLSEWANISVVMNYTPEVVSYRIIQDALDHVHLLMVKHPDIADDDLPAIEGRVLEGLRGIFKDDDLRISTEWVDDIPSDPNGKLRVIVNTME